MMRIVKRSYYGDLSSDRNFIRVSQRHAYISASVRDWILPNTHVDLEITKEGNLIMTPTNNCDCYKVVVVESGESSISIPMFLRKMMGTKRIPCYKQKDGKIIVQCKK